MKDLKIPKVIFKIREGDFSEYPDACAIGGKWTNKSTDDFFLKKRIVLFSLPGAFTPTCSSQQLPGFEKNYEKIKSLGIDEIYCCSVNDSYVMNAWAEKIKIKNRYSAGCDFFLFIGSLHKRKNIRVEWRGRKNDWKVWKVKK